MLYMCRDYLWTCNAVITISHTYTSSSRQIYISWLGAMLWVARGPLHASSSHLFIAASDQLTYIVCNLNWPTWGACGRSRLCMAFWSSSTSQGKSTSRQSAKSTQVESFLLQKASQYIIMAALNSTEEHLPRTSFIFFTFLMCFYFSFWICLIFFQNQIIFYNLKIASVHRISRLGQFRR